MIRKAPAQPRNPVQPVSQPMVVPAPTGGWNVRDPISNMPSSNAVELLNFFPDTAAVDLRKGAQNHVTGFAERVKSLFSYSPLLAANKQLFAATDDGIYDATTAGAVGSAEVAITEGYCQAVNFTTAAASYLVVVNGTDDALIYDGSTWTSVTGASTPAITGIDTDLFIHVNVFKRRLWFVEKESLSAWFLPIDSGGGAAKEFTFGQYCPRGGHLVALATWTFDGGVGLDDYLVAITSEGELLIFQGTDPTDANAFGLTGVYFIGAPLGARCFHKLGGDLLYLCESGLFPLSKALQSADSSNTSAISNIIQTAFTEAAIAYGENSGWEVLVYPAASAVIVNIPSFVGSRSDQYVMNLNNGAWCHFTNWNAACFTVHDGALYFGGEDKVAQAWTGTSDFGSNIVGLCYQAFQYLGNSPLNKHVKLVNPILHYTANFDFRIGVNVDYELLQGFTEIQIGGIDGSRWDTAEWDTAVWAAEATTEDNWRTTFNPIGKTHSITLLASSNVSELRWTATNLLYEIGGVI